MKVRKGSVMRKRVFWMYWDWSDNWWRYSVYSGLDLEEAVTEWLILEPRGVRHRVCYGDPKKPREAVVLAEITR